MPDTTEMKDHVYKNPRDFWHDASAQHRPEYVIPQRCADAVISSCKSMMALVVLEQW
jgi:hypothetical protein